MRLLGGEAAVTGENVNNERARGLTRGKKARSGREQGKNNPAEQTVCVKPPHLAHRSAGMEQRGPQVLPDFSEQSD